MKTWEKELISGFNGMLADKDIVGDVKGLEDHLKGTPVRIVKSFSKDFFTGVSQDPKQVLKTTFSNKRYDEVIIVSNIDFVSFCMHHALPFFGHVHFGYLPGVKIVGLSKIPRLVNVLSRRLQIQENLAVEIVDIFQDVVSPLGCGVVIEASHMCMSIRGVEKQGSITTTTALRGKFHISSLKSEFLHQIESRRRTYSL